MLFLLHADAFFIRMTYTYILLYTQNRFAQHILLDSSLNKSFDPQKGGGGDQNDSLDFQTLLILFRIKLGISNHSVNLISVV